MCNERKSQDAYGQGNFGVELMPREDRPFPTQRVESPQSSDSDLCLALMAGLALVALLSTSLAAGAQSFELVRDFVQGSGIASFDPDGLVDLGSVTILEGRDPQYGQEVWTTDGTSVGTELLKDFFA